MTREDIIHMAREAGFNIGTAPQIEKFADIVVSFERKRLHDKFMEIHKSQQHSNNYWHFAARKIMEES
jgi:hypothetical protein